MRSFQYTCLIQGNFSRSLLEVNCLMRPMVSLTAYLGGIIITMWIWSMAMFFSRISQPGRLSSTCGKSFPRYPFTPGFRMRRRYFGIQTTWYSVRYTLCPENLVSTHIFYPLYRHRYHSPTGRARGTQSGFWNDTRNKARDDRNERLSCEGCSLRWLPGYTCHRG